jgi:formylmethanofuran dehydrogenase subunit E
MHVEEVLPERTDFARLLAESSRIHGHLCPGQVLGVRMYCRRDTEITEVKL